MAFTSLLESCFINLEDDVEDSMIWSKNASTWEFTTKLGYENLDKESFEGERD